MQDVIGRVTQDARVLGVLGVQLDVWGGHVVGRVPIGKVLGLFLFFECRLH